MIRTVFRGILILVIGVALAPSAWAVYTGTGDALLTEKDLAKLPEAARAPYEQAVKAYDHIDRDAGVQYLVQAAKAAPDFVPLQFVLAERARERARFYYGVKALEYYDKAEEAIQRVLKQPLLSLEEKRQAQELLSSVRTERDLVPSKDKKMEELGFKAIVIPIAVKRAEAKGMKVTPSEISAALGNKEQENAKEVTTTPGENSAGTAEYPVAGGKIPLASYSVPTEKPAAPPPGQQPFYPGMGMPYGGGYPPGITGAPAGAPPI